MEVPLGDNTHWSVVFFFKGERVMELTAIYKRVIGLDVHQAKISACAVAEQADGTVTVQTRELGGFKRDRRALAQWARSFGPEVVVMESTGIYWKSPYGALEAVGIAAWVINARRVLCRAWAQDRRSRCSVAGHLGACGLGCARHSSRRPTSGTCG